MNPFTFHTGLEYEQHGDQWIGPCPFCEKPDKFYFRDGEFLWDCKNGNCIDPQSRKNRSGNIVSFLRQMYDEFDTITKAGQIVAGWRDLPLARVTSLGLKFNPWNNTILIPTYKNGKINNIYKAEEGRGKNGNGEWKDIINILCTPSVEHTIMNFPEDAHDTVWVCEGHWDRIAAEAIVGNTNNITCIGVPGAGVWKRSWTDILADKNVVFCYDNDNSGKVGFERVIMKHIAAHPQKPKSISYLAWPEGTKDKYDLNDAYRDYGRKTLDFIQENIKPFKTPEGTVVVKSTIETVQADRSIDNFDKLLTRFREVYHSTSDMELCLLMVLCSIYSINIEGEQLWLRVIGPPGCGKTTIAKAVSASDQVVLKSTFTGLFSGWRDDSGEDKSLVPTISGKTLIVKDADALLRQPNVERIFSELRDFYDKDSSTGYRHGFNHDYRNIRSTMILCGTNVLRRSDQSFLGERFLDFELRITRKDEELISQKMLERSMASAASMSGNPPDTPVQAAAKGFIDHLMDRPMDTRLDSHTQGLIIKLAKLAALMRTKVDRDLFGRGEITFAPVSELPTRLIGQLVKVGMCAPVVLKDTSFNTDEITNKLLCKTVRDIIDPTSNRYTLCMDLMEGWFTREMLMESTGISKATVTRELDNLRALRLVDERKVDGARVGFKRLAFSLNEKVKEGLKLINNV